MSAEYTWERWPQAEALIDDYVENFLAEHAPARILASDMHDKASTRLFDWLDHLAIGSDATVSARVQAAGFEPEQVEAPQHVTVFHHPSAQLPRLLLAHTAGTTATAGHTYNIAIKADSISDFLLTHGLQTSIAGTPLSPYRVAKLWPQGDQHVSIVERRGYHGFTAQEMPPDYAHRYLAARERWAARPRLTDNDEEGMIQTLALAKELVTEVGADTAAWIAFEGERDYWQRRNWAGQVQKARQDSIGLGWANHDHHTFRSSRTTFATLIATLETLGFSCRERFYAGEEAGWGAQVLEQPQCGLVVFADVDLRPDETELDFAHTSLSAASQLGTVGLWCALHGESLLGAGMHHLEAQFEFERLRDDLAAMGVGMMKPFSDMEHLRQAFTKGERWPVAPARLERLRAADHITDEQYQTFLSSGAIGSHLENLQRREGYKGFNQHNVSTIIKATDPRRTVSASSGQ